MTEALRLALVVDLAEGVAIPKLPAGANLLEWDGLDAEGPLGWRYIAASASDENRPWQGSLGPATLREALNEIVRAGVACGALLGTPDQLFVDAFVANRVPAQKTPETNDARLMRAAAEAMLSQGVVL